jgi:hypothetical protein
MLMTIKKNKELLALLKITVIFIAIFFVMAMSIFIFDWIEKIEWYYYLIYFVVAVLSIFISRYVKNKAFKYGLLLIGGPIYLVFAFAIITYPYYLLFGHFLYFVLICFMIPFTILQKLINHQILGITIWQALFLVVTIGTISTIIVNKKIISLILLISPARLSDTKAAKNFLNNNRLDLWLDKNNLRMIYYSIFFIYLFYYSFLLLSDKITIKASSFENAWLQSFLCFIAFDSIILNSKSVQVLPTMLLKEIIKLINLSESKEEK